MRSLRPGLVAGVICVALTAACSSTVAGHGRSLPRPAAPHARTSSSAPVQQPVTFSDCGFDFSSVPFPGNRRAELSFGCAELHVPLDYANESGPTTTVELIKVHDNKNTTGKHLVVNPGGPGASGIEAAVGLAVQVSDKLLDNYDLVGFDPRGVNLSSPIHCLTDTERDTANAEYFDVRTDAGFAAAKAAAQQFATACNSRYGAKLADFTTVQTAHDMDRIRQALADKQLNYLGFSYGTELGGVYAHLFPSKLGVAVLDGAVDPLTDGLVSFGDQVAGFESAFDQFAADCVTRSCASGDPRQDVYQLTARAATDPIPSGKAADPRRATVSLLLTGVIRALYSRSDWPKLGRAISAALTGSSEQLLQLADVYNERNSTGQYSNILDANTTISCNDSPPGPTDAQIKATAAEWATHYPMFGVWSAGSLFGCQQWQPHRTPVPRPSAPTTPDKVLVVGNLHDPATPYQGAKDLTKVLGHAELLTWDGEGHTSYLGGSTCIDNYVDNYLVGDTLPPDNTTCPK